MSVALVARIAGAAIGSGGVSPDLSNLIAPTAINQDLILDTGAAAEIETVDALGGTSKGLSVYTGEANTSGNLVVSSGYGHTVGSGSATFSSGQGGGGGAISGAVSLASGDADGGSGAVNIRSGTSSVSGNITGAINIGSGSPGDDSSSGHTTISTGAVNTTIGGPSAVGNIILQPGAPTGGSTPGAIKLVTQTTPSVGNVWTASNADGSGDWAASSGAAAGSTKQVQFNSSGAFGASANLSWDNSAKQLTVGPTAGDRDLNISSAAEPTLEFYQTSAAANAKRWQFTVSGGSMYLQALNDALSGDTALVFNRSGGTVTNVQFYHQVQFPDYSDGVLRTVSGVVTATAGASGSFLSADAKTVTVTNGIITSIV